MTDSLGCLLQTARGQTAGVADDGSRRRVLVVDSICAIANAAL